MKSYEFVKTDDKDLERVVDRNGDWTHYYYKPTNQYLRSVNFILDAGYAKGIGFIQYLKNKSADEIDRKLREAGDRGDAIHQFIKKILSGEKVGRETQVLAEDNIMLRILSDDEWDAILSFQSFWNAHEPKLIVYEKAIYNLKDEYAGTLDGIIRLTKKCEVKTCRCNDLVEKVGLYDWKSGGGIWDSYGAQIASYGVAYNLRALALQKAEYTAILRIGTSHKTTGGYEFQPYDRQETNIHYKEFLAAKQIADANYKSFNPEKEIYEIPDTLNIKVERELIKPITKKHEHIKTTSKKIAGSRKRRTRIS